MSNVESKKIQGRLERRERRVRDAVVLMDQELTADSSGAQSMILQDVDGVPVVVRLLQQLSEAGIERVYVVGGTHLTRLRDRLSTFGGIPDVRLVEDARLESQNSARALRLALETMTAETRGARPFILVQGDLVMSDDRILKDFVSDPRPNVLAVQLRLAHTMGAEELKVQMEPVDVPWYTRRVVGLGRDLQPQFCHGESIGLELVGAQSFGAVLDALRDLSTDTAAARSDAFTQAMMDGHEFYTSALQPGACATVRDQGDLEAVRASAATRRSELAG